MTDDAERFGDPRIPDETITSKSHLFQLGALPPATYDGGIAAAGTRAELSDTHRSTGQHPADHVAARRYSRTALASQRVGDQSGHQGRRDSGSSSTETATTRVSKPTSTTSCSHPKVPCTTSRTSAPKIWTC